jgi:hypothetical protein
MLKVGDIVKFRPNKTLPSGSARGVVIEQVMKSKGIRFHSVYWFRPQNIQEGCDVVRCEGLKDKEVCTNCEYRDLCPHLQEIARCDISEFGQFRGEGELDFDICEQRKCKHLGVCLTNRWIP